MVIALVAWLEAPERAESSAKLHKAKAARLGRWPLEPQDQERSRFRPAIKRGAQLLRSRSFVKSEPLNQVRQDLMRIVIDGALIVREPKRN